MNKKLCIYFVSFMVLSLASCVTTGRSIEGTVSLDQAIQNAVNEIELRIGEQQGKIIALINFTSTSESFSAYVLDRMEDQLVRGRKVEVVDRLELHLVRQEMNFQMSGDVSDESMRSIGQQLGAEFIISGSFTPIGNVYSFRMRGINVTSATVVVSSLSEVYANESRVVSLMTGSTGTMEQAESPNELTTPISPVLPSQTENRIMMFGQIPINIRVLNDRANRIQTTFSRIIADAGFRVGGNNSRYRLDVGVNISNFSRPNNPNKFVVLEVSANLMDTSSYIVVLPYNIHVIEEDVTSTLVEAEYNAFDAVIRLINEGFKKSIDDHLSVSADLELSYK